MIIHIQSTGKFSISTYTCHCRRTQLSTPSTPVNTKDYTNTLEMSTPTAAEITNEIEALDRAVQDALLNGDISKTMNTLRPRIVSDYVLGQ